MSKVLRSLRGALGMGVLWAAAWAIVGGGIMEGIVDPRGEILDMWPQTLAIPGFISGVVFFAMLRIAEGRTRFDELSLRRFAGLGAVTGLLLGACALTLGIIPNAFESELARAAVVLGPVTVLNTIFASGSLTLARLAERGALRGRDGTPEIAAHRTQGLLDNRR